MSTPPRILEVENEQTHRSSPVESVGMEPLRSVEGNTRREFPPVENLRPVSDASIVSPPPSTQREIHRQVWTLAWPSVMTMLLQTFNSLMDVFFVGHLPNGAAALAATGVGGSIVFLLISLAMGVSVGTTALVARFTGAREPEQVALVTGQSITLSFVIALLFGTLTYVGRGPMVALMLDSHRSPESAALCVQFLSAALLCALPLFVMNALMGAFRGLGDTRTPLLITCVTIAVHITGNAVLIYGRLGLPALGVRGAGIALASSVWVGCALYIVALLYRSPLQGMLQRRHLRLSREWAWRILRIGIPAALQALIRTLGMMSFTGLLARTVEGAAGVAAMQIGLRAEGIAFMPGFGYSVATSALVGQSLGAKDTERAERYAWAASVQSVTVMTFMAVVFYCLATPLTRLFTHDSTVLRLGTDYLRINAFSEPFLGVSMVLIGALQGAGDTIRPTWITFFTMWLIRMPLAYFLMFTLHENTHGAWIAINTTTIIGGFLTYGLFRSGAWKRLKV
jgi:putative MATE family efflux protein